MNWRSPAIRRLIVTLTLSVMVFPHAASLRAQTPGSPLSSQFDAATLRQVQSLFRERRFPEAKALVEPFTQGSTPSAAAVYLLALVELQVGDLDNAKSLLANLQKMGSPDAASFAAKLQPVLDATAHNRDLTTHLADAIRRMNGTDAEHLLDQMTLPIGQKTLIHIYIDAYGGKLTNATRRLVGLTGTDVQPATGDAVRKMLLANTRLFSDISNQLRWYNDSSLATSGCTPAGAREASIRSNFFLNEYVQFAQMGLEHFPFHERFMDAAFHAAILSDPYPDVEALGDRILRAKGSLRIPFFSSNRRLSVVIDQRTRRVYTDIDETTMQSPDSPEELTAHRDFDLSFDAIRAVRQHAPSNASSGSLAKGALALRLEPDGVAPHYLFMPLLHCLYGEAAQKDATRKIGQYIIHVLGRNVPSTLENPAKATRDKLLTFTAIVGSANVAAASVASMHDSNTRAYDETTSSGQWIGQSAQEGKDLLERRARMLKDREDVQKLQRDAKESWYDALADTATGSILTQINDDLENLVDLVKGNTP